MARTYEEFGYAPIILAAMVRRFGDQSFTLEEMGLAVRELRNVGVRRRSDGLFHVALVDRHTWDLESDPEGRRN